jgi:hypothetical protein
LVAVSGTPWNTLLIVMAPLVIGECLMIYPVFLKGFPLWELLIPASLLTLFPSAALQDAREHGSYAAAFALIAFDIGFLWVMVFFIRTNRRLIGTACCSLFILLSIGLFAGGS